MASETWDIIIVGAGSAGCLLANRLSAPPERKRVLLLEAGGPDSHPMIKVPIGFTRLMYDPSVTYPYMTEPEPHLDGRRVSVVRGKVLGGCSAINGMIYMRGQRQDYDDWAALPGCTGWSFAELLPYFKRSEGYQVDETPNPFHGRDGELDVTRVATTYPITEAYMAAAEQVGIARNSDLNGARQEGIGFADVNMRKGRRWSSADAFLSRSVRRRDNLEVRLHTLARRLVLEGKRVVGVEIEDAQGQVKRLQASEVVLSAGAYNTPPLLELSGIGDPKVLQGLGIDVCHPLGGVGASLQDHLQLWVQQGVKTRQTLSEDGKFPRVVWSVLRYLATRKGPLAFPAASVGAFVSTTPGERPIFQLHFTPGAGAMDEHGRMGASPEPGVNSTVCVIRPTSRGTVHAADNDPRTPPRILHNYLSTEHDRTLSIEGFRLQRRIYAAEPFARYATHELNPGPEVQSDDEILDFWRRE
ncbi:MAG: GMC family oxidoreductase N-terminal domain-containing protein, partial [Myxococcota bacterium]